MKRSDLIRYYPQVFHMAEPGSWESIRTHGLLSTSALLDLFRIDGKRRSVIEHTHRRESVTISHPAFGRVVVRDQKPMSDSALRKCLRDGLDPRDWYEILNRKVFFWSTRERLKRLLSARAYRRRTHCVITVDTGDLVARHANGLTLSPINSGNTLFNPQPRGRDTFLSISRYPFQYWRDKRRSEREAVAELAVDYSVPDIIELAALVQLVREGRPVRTLWSAPTK